jgi:phosphomannomutase/phosphoglucomutase
VLFPEGWGLVRASNTQPVRVMRFEATTPELLEAYRSEVEAVVARSVESAHKKAGSEEPAKAT